MAKGFGKKKTHLAIMNGAIVGDGGAGGWVWPAWKIGLLGSGLEEFKIEGKDKRAEKSRKSRRMFRVGGWEEMDSPRVNGCAGRRGAASGNLLR